LAKKMKQLIPLLSLLILVGCAEKEKKVSTDWALSIQANTGTREQKQAKLSGRIHYILDGVEDTKELPEYDLPISAVMQFQADRVLRVEVDAVEYDYPVFLHLIRYENMSEIKWPEEAMELKTSRFLYARTDNLKDGFSVISETSPVEIKRTVEKDVLRYGSKNDLTREQVTKIFSRIAPEITFEKREGWASTAKEKYDTDLLVYSNVDRDVGLEFKVTSRKGDSRVESMELQIIFPIGEYGRYSELIEERVGKYIKSFLDTALTDKTQADWLIEDIFVPVDSKFNGRILEVGDYVLTTYRVYWDYIDPVEHLGLWITTKRE